MVLNVSSFLYDHSVMFYFLIDKQDCLVLLVVIVLVVEVVTVVVAVIVVDDQFAEVTKKRRNFQNFYVQKKRTIFTGSIFLSFGSEYGCEIGVSSFG